MLLASPFGVRKQTNQNDSYPFREANKKTFTVVHHANPPMTDHHASQSRIAMPTSPTAPKLSPEESSFAPPTVVDPLVHDAPYALRAVLASCENWIPIGSAWNAEEVLE